MWQIPEFQGIPRSGELLTALSVCFEICRQAVGTAQPLANRSRQLAEKPDEQDTERIEPIEIRKGHTTPLVK